MTRVAVLALLLAAAFGGCRPAEPEGEGPVPALSRSGSRWQVSRGDKPVFAMANEGGKIQWAKGGETEHYFVSGTVSDTREDARLKQLVRQSRHFRDLVHRLNRAGYAVAPADRPPGT
ncbi:MAG: hypothetical protein HY553_10490 [Elusimicrobia bacterium]|nr:hypothetical protein [Elusimicrobiota bacterium]